MEIKDLREQMTPEQIKEILREYGIHDQFENMTAIQFPTCCHNLEPEEGHQHAKLYYYKENNMFRCYTACDGVFDIFQLIIKMEELRGNEITLPQAIKVAGFEMEDTRDLSEDKKDDKKSLEYFSKMQNLTVVPQHVYKGYDRQILENYSDNKEYLLPWSNEGITYEALEAFNIRYDVINMAIVIPHHDVDGNLIGVRGRFMAEDSKAKYMPLTFGGQVMAHPIRGNLYGLHENKNVIQKHKTAIIFESEKSVLKFSSYFGHENNFSVATCGNKVSQEQIQLLQNLGVKQVVLAFDKDYTDSTGRVIVQSNYEQIAKRLSLYFNTAIIMDFGTLLGYKDSPIDRGKSVFEELFKYRYYV